jgi:hypothetical protein
MSPCYICGRPPIAACTMPVAGKWIALPEEIKPGDFIQLPRDLQFYRVLSWRLGTPPSWRNIEGIPSYIFELSGVRSEVEFTATLPILRLLKTPCGIFACERHMRELDENVYQCAEHWEEMERVYSAA